MTSDELELMEDLRERHVIPGSVRDKILHIFKYLDSLREAIETHRSQKADDRCIEDDDRLYEALGDGIKCDRRVGSKEEMLHNCSRFIERRCEGGGGLPTLSWRLNSPDTRRWKKSCSKEVGVSKAGEALAGKSLPQPRQRDSNQLLSQQLKPPRLGSTVEKLRGENHERQ